MSDPYHSALHDPVAVESELDYYEQDGSVVLEHDITDGVADEFHRAEVIHSQPAWQRGYAEFQRRAGVTKGVDYDTYLKAIEYVIQEVGVPAYLVTGKRMLSKLHADDMHPVYFDEHGHDAYLALYNGADPPRYEVESVTDSLVHVAEAYDVVCDPNCGYGDAARTAQEHGANFVCADINAECVFYVASEVLDYAHR